MTSAGAHPRGPGRPRDATIDAAILQATLDELVERGFLGLSMESVAARAGIAKTTLYRRWPGKQDLAIDAMRSIESDARQPPEGTLREQLLGLLEAMRRKWSNPTYAAIMRRVAADGAANPDAYRHTRDRLIRPHVRQLRCVLARGVDEGVIAPDADLDLVRRLLTAPILASALTFGPRITRAELEFVVDTVLAGLAGSAR